MCLVWLNRSGVDATFYDAVEFDPMLTVTIGRNRPEAVIIKRCPAIMSCRVLALRSALSFPQTFLQNSTEIGSKTIQAIH